MTTVSFSAASGERFDLAAIDPDDNGGIGGKKEAKALIKENLERLRELQERLYASEDQALLIVLQAMDTAGKDGTIKHVCGAFNPQGVRVASFKAPSKSSLHFTESNGATGIEAFVGLNASFHSSA